MKHRDFILKKFCGQEAVITVDNSVSIGNQRLDKISVKPELVAKLTARVALLEALSVNARPKVITSTISLDHNSSTGQDLIKGILSEIQYFNLTSNDLTGSSETNFPAEVTSIGITVLSEINDSLLVNNVKHNDKVFLLGEPYIGNEVIENLTQLPSYSDVSILASSCQISEIIPCGSTGVMGEIEKLKESYSVEIEFADCEVNFTKSAGPATCLLAIGSISFNSIKQLTNCNVLYIGKIRSKK